MTTLTPYPRPELTEADNAQAAADARTLIRKYGMNNAMKIIAALALENVRLAKEVNEHRAARGFEPLPTFKV